MKLRAIAVDVTESNGAIRVADSMGLVCVSSDPREILKALAKSYDSRDILRVWSDNVEDWIYLKVAWDVGALMRLLSKVLPKEVIATLNSGERAVWDCFRLFYGVGKGKSLGIAYKELLQLEGNFYDKVHYESTIYELATYFPDAEDGCNLEQLQQNSDNLLATLRGMGITAPTTLSSPGAICKESILSELDIPGECDIPEEATEISNFAYNQRREWRSTYRVGYFPKVFEYDISSCYPSILAQLPNLYYAQYIHTQGEMPEGAVWGIMRGKVHITADVSPIIHEDNSPYIGTWEDYLTTDDWACIERWGVGTFKPVEGWFIKLTKNFHPFDYTVKKLWGFRSGENLKSMLAKVMANSIIGYLAETNPDEKLVLKRGVFFNPLYPCMVYSKARCNVCDFIYSNGLQDDLISVTVDGVMTTKEVPGVSNISRLGEWRCNPISEALVVSQQSQWVNDKRPGGVTLEEILNEIRAHPYRKSWNHISLDDEEYNRLFEDLPQNGKQLLDKVFTSKAKKIG